MLVKEPRRLLPSSESHDTPHHDTQYNDTHRKEWRLTEYHYAENC